MEPVILSLAAAAVGATIGITSHAIARKKIRTTLERAARDLGLVVYPWKFFDYDGRLDGLIDGLPVQVTMVRRKGKTKTRIMVKGAEPSITLRKETLAVKLGLTPERWLAPATETPWERAGDLPTGDSVFDPLIDLRGPAPFCLAALEREARKNIQWIVDEWAGKVRGGEVTVETERDLAKGSELTELVRAVHGTTKALRPSSPEEIRSGLLRNFRTESDPGVRRAVLAALGEGFPGAPDTLAISREALADLSDDWIPVQAAANLGREGIPHLKAILKDPRKDEAVHARCVRLLGAVLPEEEAEALLLEQLVDPRSAVAFAVAESFSERVGSARAVPLLTETAEHHASADVRKAARKALDAIAVKLEGVEPGGLALAPAGEDGQLSRAEGPPERPRPVGEGAKH
jgi:hypothetical protein